ncbi:MAG: hypothetical protein ACNI27_05030 [Desulfovibrio sp.]
MQILFHPRCTDVENVQNVHPVLMIHQSHLMNWKDSDEYAPDTPLLNDEI